MSVRLFAHRARVVVFVVLTLCALPTVTLAQDAPAPRRDQGTFLSLYASFAALQALDAHSTLRALNHGGVEANPFMRGVAGHPAALLSVKAATAAATIVMTEKLRKRSRVGAIAVMVGVTSAYAAVVAHNYSIGGAR